MKLALSFCILFLILSMLILFWLIFAELQSSHRGITKFLKHSNSLRSNTTSKRFFSTSCRSQGKESKSHSGDSSRKTLNSTVSRPPLIITGFVDAEGSFSVFLYKRSKGEGVDTWYVTLCFSISLHKKDRAILEMIKAHFNGVGNITTKGKDAVQYRIQSLTDISLVINHFDLHPLYSQKQVDYTIFKQIFEMVKNKEHLNKEGLEKIVTLRSSLNWGLSDKLQGVFPNISETKTPEPFLNTKPIDSNWVVGFTSGEGCFYIRIGENSKYYTGYQVQLRFQITQHIRDVELMNSLVTYFGCGTCELRPDNQSCDFFVRKLSDLNNIIIPFFE